MPHAEVHFTADLDLDAVAVLTRIERIFNDLDPEAGACKGRAYPIALYHHTHVLIRMTGLAKPTRDGPFTMRLLDAVETAVAAHLPPGCWLSIDLSYSGPLYRTRRIGPD